MVIRIILIVYLNFNPISLIRNNEFQFTYNKDYYTQTIHMQLSMLRIKFSLIKIKFRRKFRLSRPNFDATFHISFQSYSNCSARDLQMYTLLDIHTEESSKETIMLKIILDCA